jgi:hypothetical protein
MNKIIALLLLFLLTAVSCQQPAIPEATPIFLKHWLPEFMPPTVRDGLLFVDDSQGFGSLEDMVAEFTAWGETFAPAPVAFQFGYQSDRLWWDDLENPPQAIGEKLVTAVPNLAGLYWVDFTILEMFPPER